MTNYTRKLARGTAIVFGSTVVTTIFGYLLRMLLARKFSVEDYGLIYSIIALFGFFTIFVGLGLSTALTKYIAEFKAKNKYKDIKNSIVFAGLIQFLIALGIGVVLIIFSKKISIFYLKIEGAQILIILFAIFFILIPIFNTIKAAFRGFQDMKYYSLMEISQPVLIFVSTAILILFGIGLSSVMISHAVFVIAGIILFYYFLIKICPKYKSIKFEFDRKLIKKLLKYGITIILASSLGIVFGRIDTIILTFFRSLEEVGLYNVAFPTVKAAWSISFVLMITLFPMISELWAKKEYEKLKKGIDKLYAYNLFIMLPITALVFFFPEAILSILFGSEYIGAATCLRIFSFAILITALYRIGATVLNGIGKPKDVTIIYMIGGGLNLAGNFILIPFFGINGAAISTVASFLFVLVFINLQLKKCMDLKLDTRNHVKIIAVGILFALIIYVTSGLLHFNFWVETILSVAIASSAYLLLIFKLNLIKFKELKAVIRSVI